MGNAAGVRRDFEGLERRRMAAAELLKQGVSQSEVARRLGVHRQSVIRWARQLAQSGRAGLKQAGRAGRKPKLSASQLRKIELLHLISFAHRPQACTQLVGHSSVERPS